MRYISLFSGIEAATVAWEPLGWEPVAFAEVEPFPSAVLAARWPEVPNLGDVTKVDWSEYRGAADLVIGGSPCQSFSVAGLRRGLADPRGNLMLEFLRACEAVEPEWVVWENVPGVLSSGRGEDFAAFQGAVAQLWPRGGCAWRVLDAQFFGVAQRRRRVFAVINTRDWRRAAAVLLEPGCLRGDTQTSREKREELARAAGVGARSAGFKYHAGASAGSLGHEDELSPTLTADWHEPAVLTTANTNANGSSVSLSGASYTLDRANSVAVAYSIPENAVNRPTGGTNGTMAYGPGEPAPTLRASRDAHAVAFAQDARDEVRLQAGDVSVCGALSAQPDVKQQTYVMTQYGEELAGTLRARHDSSPTPGNGQNVVCAFVGEHGGDTGLGYSEGVSPTVSAKHAPSVLCMADTQANAAVGGLPSLTAHGAKDAPVVCVSDDQGGSAVDEGMCGTLKAGGWGSVNSGGEDVVGPLCARDCKGVGSEYVREGKVVCQRLT